METELARRGLLGAKAKCAGLLPLWHGLHLFWPTRGTVQGQMSTIYGNVFLFHLGAYADVQTRWFTKNPIIIISWLASSSSWMFSESAAFAAPGSLPGLFGSRRQKPFASIFGSFGINNRIPWKEEWVLGKHQQDLKSNLGKRMNMITFGMITSYGCTLVSHNKGCIHLTKVNEASKHFGTEPGTGATVNADGGFEFPSAQTKDNWMK